MPPPGPTRIGPPWMVSTQAWSPFAPHNFWIFVGCSVTTCRM